MRIFNLCQVLANDGLFLLLLPLTHKVIQENVWFLWLSAQPWLCEVTGFT